MSSEIQQFGGHWSADKLNMVRKYLSAYTTIMAKYNYKFAYIDAFAGTGYQKLKNSQNNQDYLLPELTESDSMQFLDGSARNALNISPPFQTYIFIEKDKTKFDQLQSLKTEFPNIDIILKHGDCNSHLQELCRKDWTRHRAVLFLDPFGMQVQWQTIKSIANTQAIDLWILFPLGVAVNRILRRDGNISDTWANRLDELFGTTDWYKEFYKPSSQMALFGEPQVEKVANFDAIGNYFISRLEIIFAGVAQTPRLLYNSKGNPLYMLCFAAGNEKGAKIAVKIAQHILKKP